MTTQDLIDSYIEAGRKVLTKRTAGRHEGVRRLIRHEAAVVDGVEYQCLRELVVVKVAEEMQRILPDAEIRAVLDGNDSAIEAELTDDERERLNSRMYLFLSRNKCL